MKKKRMQILVCVIIWVMIAAGCGAVTNDNADSMEKEELIENPVESIEAIEEPDEEAVVESTTEAETTEPEEVPEPEEVSETEEVSEPEGVPEAEEVLEPTEPAVEEEPAVAYTYTDLSKTMYAKSSVNVRDLPSTEGNKLGGLTTNQEVAITGQCNETGWYRILYNDSVAFVSNNYIVSEKVEEQVATTQNYSDGSGHNYYKNLTAEQAAAADAVAKLIADSIMSDTAYTTDLERVNAAAQIVAAYCSQCAYGSDQAKWYRSPYGVFIGGVYTCAGSARALGRVLDFMGFSWQHVNENQNKHQWCVLTMDGQTGFADGMGGFAGYGEMTSGMTLPDGRTIFF